MAAPSGTAPKIARPQQSIMAIPATGRGNQNEKLWHLRPDTRFSPIRP